MICIIKIYYLIRYLSLQTGGQRSERRKMIKYIYILFTGLLLAFFVGIGIATFYPGPEEPEYPRELNKLELSEAQNASVSRALQDEYDLAYEQYSEARSLYGRNVSIILVVVSMVLLVLSLSAMKNMPIISDGTLLGGLFTLFYGVIQGFMTDDNNFRFLIISFSLLVALAMGYVYFVKPQQAKLGTKKK